MPGARLLLDTNAAIGLLNRSLGIAARVSEAEGLALPLIVLGELEFGARNSAKREGNLDALARLLKEVPLLLPDRATAAAYGDIKTTLRRKGHPIPDNDIWIAALAVQHELPLLSNDAHFQEVHELVVVSW